jgi:hypothetical protein
MVSEMHNTRRTNSTIDSSTQLANMVSRQEGATGRNGQMAEGNEPKPMMLRIWILLELCETPADEVIISL